MADALRFDGVGCRLGAAEVLHAVSFAVAEGELVALVGPNGAGKSTLLRAAAGLVSFTGEIAVAGRPAGDLNRIERARTLAYLPQGHLFHWPVPAWDVVALGRLPLNRGADPSEADRAAIAEAMEAAGVTAFADRPVTSLSGGERARVALARVLATGASVLLADEPTSSLDPYYQLAVADLLRRQAAAGGAVLAVVHDLALAARFADRIAVLDGGRLAACGAPDRVLTPDLLARTFRIEASVETVAGVPVVVPAGPSGGDGGKRVGQPIAGGAVGRQADP